MHAIDPGRLREARALHDDMLVVNGLDASEFDDALIRNLREGGVDVNVLSSRRNPSLLESLDSPQLRLLARRADDVVLATSVADIHRARADGKIAIVFAWQVANRIGEDENTLVGYHRLGLRSSGLVYNVGNYIGSGCVDPDQGPLSKFGVRVVETLQEFGIAVDIGGHCSEATSFDVLRIAEGPVVCSHTNPRTLRDAPRAMTDQLFKAIAATGGVIGITAFNFFLTPSGRATIHDYLRHIDYTVKLVGADHVGMGLDFLVGKQLSGSVDSWLFPPAAYPQRYEDWIYPETLSDFSGVPLVTAGLLRMGYREEDVRKIMGLNWLRVWEEIWGE